MQCAYWQLSILGLRWLERQNEVAQFEIKIDLLRARSQIPVFGLTGRTPDWPGTLKLLGAAVKQTYKYYTPERQCVTCVLVISIHTSRFGIG